MYTLAEFLILYGADNRLSMLEKHLYDSWKSRMVLYMQNREQGIMILESVEHGPLIWRTIEENGVSRTKKYEELSATEKIEADFNQQTHVTGFPQIDSDLAVPVFKQGDDPIDAINKIMSLLSTIVSSRFPTTNNQLKNSSNPRQQATIHDGRVTVQLVQGRQSSFAAGTSGTRANISGIGGNNSGQQRVVKCFNCQGEGHMARQCPKPKRKRDATWFRDKVLLVEVQGSGKVLNEEELEFLADLGVAEAKVVLMANLSSYGSDVLSEAPHSKITHNDMLNQTVQDTNSSTQQDAMILSMFEQLSNQVTNCNKVNKDNLIANESLSAELERYKERFADFEKEINYLKQTLSEQSKEKELLTKTFNVFKNESKEKEAKNIDNKISLEKKVKELDNIKAQQIRPMIYDGSVIATETNMISIADSEETLMLEEESRLKMILKQSDPKVLEKKVNIKQINYAELNRLSKDFGKHFVPQQELSDEQAFRLQTSHPNTDQSASSLVKIEAPRA
ncbi:retrovirus-related pol polyprotein from transposon TNT 1-94 [Tanacetum coccineum]